MNIFTTRTVNNKTGIACLVWNVNTVSPGNILKYWKILVTDKVRQDMDPRYCSVLTPIDLCTIESFLKLDYDKRARIITTLLDEIKNMINGRYMSCIVCGESSGYFGVVGRSLGYNVEYKGQQMTLHKTSRNSYLVEQILNEYLVFPREINHHIYSFL